MNSKHQNLFANVRNIVARGVVCMLLFAVVSCESSKPDENGYDNVEKCECDFDDDDFDLSELNKENCDPVFGWAVGLTPKSEITDSLVKNPQIKTLVAKYDVTFEYSWGIYILRGKDCSNICHNKEIVRAFLATCLFEHVRVFEIIILDDI